MTAAELKPSDTRRLDLIRGHMQTIRTMMESGAVSRVEGNKRLIRLKREAKQIRGGGSP